MIENLITKEVFQAIASESLTLKEFLLGNLKEGISGNSLKEASLNNFMPRNGGEWFEEDTKTIWKPNRDVIPDPDNGKNGNPYGLTWGEILDKYDIEGIEFKNGFPDFSSVMESEVQIDNFTSDRRINFNQADTKQAEQWNSEGKDGRSNWTPNEVGEWRKENNYTWHECEDCKTMQLVPTEVHNNIPHTGGIAIVKSEETSKKSENL